MGHVRKPAGVLIKGVTSFFKTGLRDLHASLLLHPAMLRRLDYLAGSTSVGDCLALVQQQLNGLELADDLIRCVAVSPRC